MAMQFTLQQNSVTVHLESGDAFILAKRMVKGHRKFDTRWLPPFILGSPFFRMYYGTYWGMREVKGDAKIEIKGTGDRGNFHVLKLAEGQRYYVAGHALAGFSPTIKSLRTHIKFQLPYWLLEKHFFPVFEGPGEVLLYSKSAFEELESAEFQCERIVAFDIQRQFQPHAPTPERTGSKLHNLLLSREVIWRFTDGGVTIAERHSNAVGDERDDSFAWRTFKHVLGFLRF